jgi:LmbE family N-acetylglucosaminyl deacetylase
VAPVELLEQDPARVLAVYAHPDDAEVSCGGTLARWAEAGATVHVVLCTRGDKGSSDPCDDPDELARRRAEEAAAGAEQLGVSGLEQFGYDDGAVENDLQLRRRLVEVIRWVRPEVVMCPDPTASFFGSSYVNHHDHRALGWATVDACAPAASSPLYFRETGPAHAVRWLLLSGTLEPDVWVDISTTIGRKSAAVGCHRSQVGGNGAWIEDLVRQRAAAEGAKCGVAYAECFRRIRLLGG